jgi:hypothetical protein
MKNRTYTMECAAGVYTADSWLALGWEIVKHRFQHFCNGDGWID